MHLEAYSITGNLDYPGCERASRTRRDSAPKQRGCLATAFPPRQKPGSFSLDQVLQRLQEAGDSGKH